MTITKRAEITGSATANAGGTATVVLNGPSSGRCDISSVAVIVSPGTPIPTCTMYDGPVAADGRVMAVLRAGDRGTFRADTGDILGAGQQITIQWVGTAAGAVCRAVLRGTTVQP